MSRAKHMWTASKPREATPRAVRMHLGIASGTEAPVRSPALELQEALEDKVRFLASRSPPRRAIVASLGLGLIAIVFACAAFWFAVGRMLLSLA